jgi:molecular chaperone DnaK
MYTLGVDLGTTFTAAAVWRDGRAEISPLGMRTAEAPSVVLPRADGSVLTGEAAARRALIEPDRVAREFKRRIGDSTPLLLGGSPYSAVALTSRLLAAVVSAVTDREGERPRAVWLCHPANWGPFKTDLLRQAAQLADLGVPVGLTTEPEAAAVSYARQERLAPGDTVAVYDLGGGTFDAAVLRRTPRGFEILGQPEGIERLGGVDIDAAVFQHVVRSVGSAVTDLDEDDPAAMAGVARLRAECTEAKEALSSDTDVTIPVLLPATSTEVRLTRAELEDMVRPALYDSIESLKRAIRSAGVDPADLTAVLLVGGSSRMPLVAQLVGAELGRPIAVDTHPKHAVALGAAWLASGAVLPTEPEPPRPAERLWRGTTAEAAPGVPPAGAEVYAGRPPGTPAVARPAPATAPTSAAASAAAPPGPRIGVPPAAPSAGGGPGVPPAGRRPGGAPIAAAGAADGAPTEWLPPQAGAVAPTEQLPPQGGYPAGQATYQPSRGTQRAGSYRPPADPYRGGGPVAEPYRNGAPGPGVPLGAPPDDVPRRGGGGLVITLLAVIVLLLGVGAVWYLKENPTAPSGAAQPAGPPGSADSPASGDTPGYPTTGAPTAATGAAPPPTTRTANATTQLTVNVVGSGQISGAGQCAQTCTIPIPRGRSSALHAEAAYGFAFVRWTGCATASGPDCTVLPLHSTLSVSAVFAEKGNISPTAGLTTTPTTATMARTTATTVTTTATTTSPSRATPPATPSSPHTG